MGLAGLARGQREVGRVDLALHEVLHAANAVRHGNAGHVLLGHPAGRQQRAREQPRDLLLGIARRHALALEIGDRLDRRIVAHIPAHHQREQRCDDADILLLAALEHGAAGFREGGHHAHRDREVELAVIEQRQRHDGAALRYDPHLHPCVLDRDLGDAGAGGISERSLRVGADADRLRRGARRGECGCGDRSGCKKSHPEVSRFVFIRSVGR